MNVGQVKSRIVTDLIAKHKPGCMVELGSYVGYSTISFAAALKRHGGTQYISFERDPTFAHVASSLAKLAGLSDIVRFVVGSSSKNLIAEHAASRLGRIDMMFLDHHKPSYVRDLKICESLGLITEGTVLAADNVIYPGNPSYLAYVRSSVDEKKQALTSERESQAAANRGFSDRTINQYKDAEFDDTELSGDPALIYESTLFLGPEPTGEPDGVEVTVCRGK